MPQSQQNEVETKVITNFGGRLTRILNGDLDSGLAKLSTSWGYDPFSKPMNLTWFEQPVDTDPNAATITDCITASKSRVENSATPYIYAIGHTGILYKINPQPNFNSAAISSSVIGNASVLTGYTYGGGMEFYGSTEKIYVGGDNGVASVNFDGSGAAVVGTTSSSSVVGNMPRPLDQFAGTLSFGNGNNIGNIDSTGTVTSYTKLSPGFPPEITVRDLQVSADLNYLLLAAGIIPGEAITGITNDRFAPFAGTGYIFQWNGSDLGVTGGINASSFPITALHAFLDKQLALTYDTNGAGILDGADKVVTLSNIKAPLPNATSSNGNFLSFGTVEYFNSKLQGSLFYYGQLDSEVGPGLWRLFALPSTQANGFIHNIAWQIVSNSMYTTTNNGSTAPAVEGYGKHLFSTVDVANGGGTVKYKLYYFTVTSTGTGTPNLGVYETQTQLFGKMITVKQIRVYTEPTATGNGFQIDCIGGDGTVISNSAANTYTYAAGTDVTKIQGSLERINFNPVMKDTYALGLRITNTGTANMTIHKIEIDYAFSGK